MITRTGVSDGIIQFLVPQRHDYATHLLYTSALSVLPIMFPSINMLEIHKRMPFVYHT